jgi:AcrR family transcriptional regulator
MDDIARAAGISKKTIYQTFLNKNEILSHVVKRFLVKHKQDFIECKKEAGCAIEEVMNTAHLLCRTVQLFNQSFFYDLERSFPEVWDLITTFRKQVLVPSITANLETGIAQQVYRPEIDIDLMTDVRVQQILTAFGLEPSSQRWLQRDDLLMELTVFYMHGIATVKGKKMISKFINVNNEKRFSN